MYKNFQEYLKEKDIRVSTMFDREVGEGGRIAVIAMEYAKEYINKNNIELNETNCDKIMDIANELYYMFKKYIDLGIEDLYNKYLELSKSENAFIDTYGEDEYEGLVTVTGKFFSLFRGYGYQLSGDINGHIDCGSSSGMNFIPDLRNFDDNLKRIFIDYFVDLALIRCYDLQELTESDNVKIENFKKKQIEYLEGLPLDEDELTCGFLELPNKIYAEDDKIKIEIVNNNVLVTFKIKDMENIVVEISNDMLSRIVAQTDNYKKLNMKEALSVAINCTRLKSGQDKYFGLEEGNCIFSYGDAIKQLCEDVLEV